MSHGSTNQSTRGRRVRAAFAAGSGTNCAPESSPPENGTIHSASFSDCCKATFCSHFSTQDLTLSTSPNPCRSPSMTFLSRALTFLLRMYCNGLYLRPSCTGFGVELHVKTFAPPAGEAGGLVGTVRECAGFKGGRTSRSLLYWAMSSSCSFAFCARAKVEAEK